MLLPNLLRQASALPRFRTALPAFALSALVTALAQVMLFEALDRARVTVIAPLMGTGVLWTVVLAAIFLGRSELVGRRLLVVALLVVAGGALVAATRWRARGVGSGPVRGRLAICAVLSVLALLVAGCGGSNQTKAEAWADDVCSSVNTWADTVQQSKATLTDTGNLTVASAKGALTDVEDAHEDARRRPPQRRRARDRRLGRGQAADDAAVRHAGHAGAGDRHRAQRPDSTRSARCSARSRPSRPRSRPWARPRRPPTTTSAASTAAS